MTRTLLFFPSLSLALAVTPSVAQNLVPNPSFDVQTDCPEVSEIELAPPWYAPTNGTPDLFQTGCPSQNGPGHSGIGSSGVFVHGEGAFADYREYVQAPLTSPLVAGQGYCVSVWVQRANFRYATDRFGVLLTTSAVSLTNTDELPYAPQVENPTGNILGGTGWHLISGDFYAEGGEQYITVGSFSTVGATTVAVANEASTSNVAFYRMDDISVTPCNVGINDRVFNTFDVYPQPASERISVRLPDQIRLENARLHDTNGRLVRSFTERGVQTGTLALDVTGLAGGLYHLLIDTDRGSASRTIMIEP